MLLFARHVVMHLAVCGAGASFFSEAFRSTRQSAAHVITGLASCPEGIVSGCLDGTIRFHPVL